MKCIKEGVSCKDPRILTPMEWWQMSWDQDTIICKNTALVCRDIDGYPPAVSAGGVYQESVSTWSLCFYCEPQVWELPTF